MVDPQPRLVELLVRHVLLPRELLTAGFLGRHEDLDLGQRAYQEPQILNNRLPAGKGYGVASAIRRSWTRPP